jgi:3-deoxy-D-manno-octulosonate 8-phosphate phosphatase (KDO 8-P phosphatase)
VSVSELFARIDALVMDVDGVLTDGTFIWSQSGEESKQFSFEDVMGLSRARQAGIRLGFISGEDSNLVDRFAAKVGATDVVKGCKQKGIALRDIAEKSGIALDRFAFVGDDVNDLPALLIAGLSVAPANAQPPVKAAASLVLSRAGGHGAVRELVELLLAARATADTHASVEIS